MTRTNPMKSADELLIEAEALSSAIWSRRAGRALDEAADDADRYRQAFDAFTDQGDGPRAVRLMSALRDLWWARGQYAEGLAWIGRVLRVPALPSASRATALDHAGALTFAQGQYARAKQFFQSSVELRRGGDSKRDLAVALNHLAAAVRWACADPRDAEPLYQESLALAGQVGDRLLMGAALMPLGTLALDRSALQEAEQLLHNGLGHYIKADVKAAFPLAFEQFAALAAARGHAARALRLAGAGAAWRRRLSTYPTPYTAWIEGHVSKARLMLSETKAQEAWRCGEAMNLDHALAHALKVR